MCEARIFWGQLFSSSRGIVVEVAIYQLAASTGYAQGEGPQRVGVKYHFGHQVLLTYLYLIVPKPSSPNSMHII